MFSTINTSQLINKVIHSRPPANFGEVFTPKPVKAIKSLIEKAQVHHQNKPAPRPSQKAMTKPVVKPIAKVKDDIKDDLNDDFDSIINSDKTDKKSAKVVSLPKAPLKSEVNNLKKKSEENKQSDNSDDDLFFE
jgi:hypothetical protein